MTSLNTYTKVVHPQLTKYGFKSSPLTDAEQKKIDNLETEAAHYLLASFQELHRYDASLIGPNDPGIRNTRWLINAFTRGNANSFYNILVILVASKLIDRQTCALLRKNLSDCTDEQIEAFLRLMGGFSDKKKYEVPRIEKGCFLTLLHQCENQKKQVLPALLALVELLNGYNLGYFVRHEYARLIALENIQTIQNLRKNFASLCDRNIRLDNMLGGTSIFDILLTDNGNRHALIALQTRLIEVLIYTESLTDKNLHAALLSLVSYDVNARGQTQCLIAFFSFIVKEGNAKTLKKHMLDNLDALCNTVHARYNTKIAWKDLNQLAAQVLGQIEPNNGVSLRR